MFLAMGRFEALRAVLRFTPIDHPSGLIVERSGRLVRINKSRCRDYRVAFWRG